MLEKQLLQLNFTKNETTVYLTLFELGKVRAGNIIDETALHRNLVYTSLDSLVERGLVTKTFVGGVAEFVANDPVALIEEIEEKKYQATFVVEELKKKQKEKPREIAVYEGIDGLKKCRDQVLQYPPSEKMFVFASQRSSTPEMEKVWKQFHKKREALGMPARFLYEAGVSKADVAWRNSLEESQAKYLPFGIEFPVWFTGVADHLEIGVPGDNPLTFRIKSREAVGAFKKFFDYFWDQDVYVERGEHALHNIFYSMLDELDAGEEYYVIGASSGNLSAETLRFFERFHESRVNKGVIANLLVSTEYFDHFGAWAESRGQQWKDMSHWKRFISNQPQPFQINLYNGKTRIVIYGDEPTVIYLDRPEIYEGFKNYFDTLWHQKNTTHYGQHDVEKVYASLLDIVNSKDEVVIYAAEPQTKRAQNFNIDIASKLLKKVSRFRLLYYGSSESNILRSKSFENLGCETKIIETNETLPISTVVAGNKVLNIVWALDDNDAVCFEIENDVVAQSLRKNFDILWNQEVQVVRGIEVIKNIWLESLQTKKLQFIGARGYFVDKCPEMFEEIRKKSENISGLSWQNVVDVSAKNHPLNKLPWMEARYNIVGSKNPNVIWLWANKVAIVNWTEDEPVVMISENKHLVQNYKDYFDELWNLKK